MTGRPISFYLAPVLLAIDAVLVAVNWSLRPERATSWTASAVFLGVMALALWLAAPRLRGNASIPVAVVFGALMMASSLGGRLVVALGMAVDSHLSERSLMVLMGAFFVFTGNDMPKTLPPLSSTRCDPARVQAVQRFAGWTWVLTGLTLAIAWLLLPVQVAEYATWVVIAAGLLTIGTLFFRLRRSGGAVC